MFSTYTEAFLNGLMKESRFTRQMAYKLLKFIPTIKIGLSGLKEELKFIKDRDGWVEFWNKGWVEFWNGVVWIEMLLD